RAVAIDASCRAGRISLLARFRLQNGTKRRITPAMRYSQRGSHLAVARVHPSEGNKRFRGAGLRQTIDINFVNEKEQLPWLFNFHPFPTTTPDSSQPS